MYVVLYIWKIAQEYYIIPAAGALLEAGSDSEAGNAGAELMEDSVSPDAEEGTMFQIFPRNLSRRSDSNSSCF